MCVLGGHGSLHQLLLLHWSNPAAPTRTHTATEKKSRKKIGGKKRGGRGGGGGTQVVAAEQGGGVDGARESG
jgi:hypothetical protein